MELKTVHTTFSLVSEKCSICEKDEARSRESIWQRTGLCWESVGWAINLYLRGCGCASSTTRAGGRHITAVLNKIVSVNVEFYIFECSSKITFGIIQNVL